MSYAYQGLADVSVSRHRLGDMTETVTNKAVMINLVSAGGEELTGLARLECAQLLKTPQHANHIEVVLVSGLAVQGPIVEHERYPDGSAWFTFNVDRAFDTTAC